MSVLLRLIGGGGGTALTLDLSDTLTLSDEPAKEVVQSLIDSITFTDSIGSKDFVQSLSDLITLSDGISGKDYEQNLSDILTLVDDLSKEYGMSQSDAITLIDNFSTDWPGISVARLRMLLGLGL